MLYPDTCDVLGFQDKLTCGAVPVPDKDAVAWEFEALLNSESVPENCPAACGAKATLTCTLCPDGMTMGKVAPGKENSPLLLEADETVTGPPVAVSVDCSVVFSPIITLPNCKLLGPTDNWPTVEAAPAPSTGTFSVGPETNSPPPTTAVLWGVKVTFTVMLLPAAKLIGNPGPVTDSPLPTV